MSHYPGFVTNAEWHDEMELIFVESGSMTCWIEGDEITLESFQGIFINSHRMRYFYNEKHEECEYIRLFADPLLLSASHSFESEQVRPFLSKYSYILLKEHRPWQTELYENMLDVQLASCGKFFEFKLQTFFMKAFTELNMHITQLEGRGTLATDIFTDMYMLKKMLLFIAENYSGKITLEDISSAAGCKKSKATQLFTKHLRTSPIEYLVKHRLAQALKLVQDKTLNAYEIGKATGFGSNGSYFSETFRKYYGISMSEYRKNVFLQ